VATDLYQVGLTLYRAVNGDPWFNRQQPSDLRSAVISGDFPDRSAFAPHVPSRLRTVIRQALDKDPTTRLPTATAFIDALTQIAVSIDWRQSTVAPGHVRWTGTPLPLGRAGLEVDLTPNGSRYDVTIHTVTSTARRAKQQAALWKSDMTNRQAYDHLNQVFRALS
jgi:serine/threonine protein kinase